MHRKLAFSLIPLCLVVLLPAVAGVFAQEKPEATSAPFDAAAYRVGERLTYNVSFAQFVSAGHIELFVAGRGRYFDRDGIQLQAHVETSGVVNVALLSLNNDYTTYVDAATGLPYRSQQVVREAGRTAEASSEYNQPAGTDAIPAKRAGEFTGTFDLLSAIYRLRAMSLTVGATHSVTVRTESQDYQADVKVVGHSMVKTNVGSFNALVVKVRMSDSPIYNIVIYLSDDEWHVPVLVTGRHDDGEIRAELAASELVAPIAPTVTPTPAPVTPNPTSRVTTPDPSINAGPPLNLPFKVGEQLNYQVYVGTDTQPVGALTFAVTARGRYFNRDGLLLTVTAQTNGAGGRLFFVNDKILSYVDPETLLPFRTEMNLAEGRWRNSRVYTVDQNRGTVTTDKNQRIEIPVGTHDLISAIYAVRTFDLTPKRQNAISILAISQPRTLLVTAQQRETIELNGQQIPALLLTLSTDDTQKNRLQIRVWVGDDARHLPLRIAAVTPMGAVHADLVIKATA